MNTSLHISYDISRNSKAASSYQIALAETPNTVTGALERSGATYNNVVRYAGVFATQSKAIEAAFGYIDGSVRVVELNCGGDLRVVLQPSTGKLPKLDEFTTAKILGSRTQRGTFIAS